MKCFKFSLFLMQYLIDNAKWLFEGGSDADDDADDEDEAADGRDAAAADEDEGEGGSESSDDGEVKKINSGKGE